MTYPARHGVVRPRAATLAVILVATLVGGVSARDDVVNCATLSASQCRQNSRAAICCWTDRNTCRAQTAGSTTSTGYCSANTCQSGYGRKVGDPAVCKLCSNFGAYSSGGTNACTKCPENTRLTDSTARTQASACTACRAGSSTGGLTGQSTCAYVMAGYKADGSTGVKPCEENQAEGTARLRANAVSCAACAIGLSTNGATGQTVCQFVVPGYKYVNNKAVPCDVDEFANDVRDRSTAAGGRCSQCSSAETTNGATAQTACNWIRAGYKMVSSSPKPCGVDEAFPTPRLKVVSDTRKDGKDGKDGKDDKGKSKSDERGGDARQCANTESGRNGQCEEYVSNSCEACKPGTTTNQGTGRSTCEYAKAGWYSPDGSKVTMCEPNTVAPIPRLLSAATKCNACPPGQITNGAKGALTCDYVIPGWRRSATTGFAKQCSRDQYSDSIRLLAKAHTCTACKTGYSTNWQTGQTSCSSYVAPGFFFVNGEGPRACGPSTYAPKSRLLATAAAEGCQPCCATTNTLVNFATSLNEGRCSSLPKTPRIAVCNPVTGDLASTCAPDTCSAEIGGSAAAWTEACGTSLVGGMCQAKSCFKGLYFKPMGTAPAIQIDTNKGIMALTGPDNNYDIRAPTLTAPYSVISIRYRVVTSRTDNVAITFAGTNAEGAVVAVAVSPPPNVIQEWVPSPDRWPSPIVTLQIRTRGASLVEVLSIVVDRCHQVAAPAA